jgi:hypothetical protein
MYEKQEMYFSLLLFCLFQGKEHETFGHWLFLMDRPPYGHVRHALIVFVFGFQ